MMRSRFLKLFAILMVLGGLQAPGRAQEFGPLKGQVFGTGEKYLVVFLHGDVSKGGPAVYHEAIMRTVAARAKQTTAIALLRPGYDNGQGMTSPGTNHKRRDQYTQKNNDLVAETLKSIRSLQPEAKLIVAGHSGGAAQLGAILGRYPGLVDTAFLLSCPCDIKKWRARYRPFPRSEKQSAIKFADQISPQTKVVAMTGARDKNTWSALAEAYIAKAKANGVDAEFMEIPGAGHWDRQLEGRFLRQLYSELN